jgi:prophage DNA circulation protein
MSSERSADGGRGEDPRQERRRAWPHAVTVLVAIIVCIPAIAGAQARRTPRPSPTPDVALEQLSAIETSVRELRAELANVRGELADVSARVDALATTAGAVKGVVEPMREEVRGLYVESSNVRAEIARLEETYSANTESLAKSRYVLTLLLVSTAVLQLVVLAVLLRSR